MSLDHDALNALKMNRSEAEAAAEHRARPWIVGGLLVSAVIAALIAWLMLQPEPVRVKVAAVRNAAAAPGNNGAVLTASGYVVARRIATASSKVTGQIAEVLIEEGDRVAADQVLARLDDNNASKQLALSESQLNRARKSVEETRVRLAEAERAYQRALALREDKLVSEAALDQANSEVNAWKARLAVSESEVTVSERGVALARQSLEDMLIRAPFAGVVVSKNAQPGEMISPISAGGGFTRTGIGTIVDMESLEIEVDVNEAYINRVREGQPVEAALDAYPDWTIPANVISIVPTADRQKATVKVRIGFAELDPRIFPDMGIQVKFLEEAVAAGNESGPRLVIPGNAMHNIDGRDYVYIYRDDRLERRAVSAGRRSRNEIEIVAGLAQGEKIVIAADGPLVDGASVELQP